MSQTALLVDDAYRKHVNPPGHPESVARIEALMDLGKQSGAPWTTVHPRPATEEEVRRAHSDEHFDRVKATSGSDLTIFDPDTTAGPDSYETALLAAGGLLEVVDAIIARRVSNGMALVRPPGHHAESKRVMGFCLFNNVAIAAAHARRHHGMDRVAILDWDVHHGNGTQEIFWKDPHVLFISMHEHPLYPGTGLASEVGEGDAEGATLNVPMSAGAGDPEYLAVLEDVVAPAIRDFAPELLLVSAGFDAHVRDPLANMRVTEEGFAGMTRIVLDVAEECCGGRTACVLEGGYDLEALRASVESVLGALSGEPAPERTA